MLLQALPVMYLAGGAAVLFPSSGAIVPLFHGLKRKVPIAPVPHRKGTGAHPSWVFCSTRPRLMHPATQHEKSLATTKESGMQPQTRC